MPIASFQLPDGKIADFEVPEGMSQEEIEQAVAPELRRLIAPPAPPKPEESGFLRQAADVPVNIAKGAASGVRALSDIFGANNPLSRAIRGTEDYLDSLLSAQARNDQQEIARIMKEAEDQGLGAQVAAGVKAFATAPVDFLAQALGSAAPIVAGGLAASVARLGAAGVGAVTTGLGAGTGAGIVKGSIYDAVKGALTEAGESPEVAEARAQAAQSYGGENWGQVLTGTALGALAGRTGVEKLLLDSFGKKEIAEQAAKGVGRRAVEGAVTEAVPEMAQAGQEQLAQNIALQREGFETPTLRGVAGAATLEGLAGGALGGGLGALSRGAPPAAPVEAPPEAPPAPPVVTNYQTIDQAGNPTTISVAQDDAGTIVATGPDGEPVDLSNMVSAGFTIEESIKSVFSAPEAPVVAAAPAPRVEPEITPQVAPVAPPPPSLKTIEPPFDIAPTKPVEKVSTTPKEDEFILQNRDRSTPASINQMNSIAANPDYGMVGFSRDFAVGAPVISGSKIPDNLLGKKDYATTSDGRRIPVQYAVVPADTVVTSNDINGAINPLYADQEALAPEQGLRAIAGNGRATGLNEAYRRGTADRYKEELLSDDMHGVDPEAIQSIDNPVLVRVMPWNKLTADIGDVSNTTGVAGLSAVDQAKTDVNRVDFGTLEFYENGEPTARAVKTFIQAMPMADQANLIDINGEPTAQAIDRFNAALFAKAYADEDLIRMFAQAKDPEARLVMSALAQLAPDMARLDGLGALDVRPIFIDAAKIIISGKRKNLSLAKIAQQTDITVNPSTQLVVDLFAKNPRSNRDAIDAIRNVTNFAYQEGTKEAEDIFGAVPKATREEVLGRLRREDEQAGAEIVEPAEGRGAVEEVAQRAAAEPGATELSKVAEEGRPSTTQIESAAERVTPQKSFYSDLLPDAGFKRLNIEDPRTYKNKSGEPFLTFERDGVRVAFSSNNILFADERGRVGAYSDEPENTIFRALIVDKDQRKKGKAAQAVSEIVNMADESGVNLYLEPASLDVEGMTTQQLKEFYKRFGFKPQKATGPVPQTDKVMVRMAGEPREELKLTGESNAEIAARLARQETDREAAERKAIADRERGLFTLTPQVSEAESAPTGDMFGARGLADQAPKRAAAPATETGLFENKISFQKAPPYIKPPEGYEKREGRNEQVVMAARLLAQNKITKKQYDDYVNYFMPVAEVPLNRLEPALTETELLNLLNRPAVRAGKNTKLFNAPIPKGTKVGLRMDIKALQEARRLTEKGIKTNGSIVSVHKGSLGGLGENLSYTSTGAITNATMLGRKEERAFKQAQDVKESEGAKKGEGTKEPLQTIEGTWMDLSPEEVEARIKENFNNPDWVQVGFDPLRHSFFYDRKTLRPIVSADEVLQIGRFVLAKNVKYSDREKFLYSVSGKKVDFQPVDTSSPNFKRFFKDSKVVDENGKPLIVYHSTTFDFDAFDTNRESMMGEGSFFSADPSNRFIEGQEGGNIIPAYLSLQNPKYFTFPLDDAFNKQKLIQEGYDGVIIKSPLSGNISVAVAFDPAQIKSAISNTGEFSPSDPRITQSVGNVTDIAEAQRVEKALKGKNPLQAAKWMADNATNPEYRLISKRIADRMQKLMDAGVPFKLHIVGVGDKVPVGLLSADGLTSSLTDRSEKKVLSVDIWLNNSTVTDRVGTEEKIVLHELIHAVTAGATYLGNLKSMQGTEAAKLFTRLYDVRNAVVRHFNSRVKSVPIDQLTELEKKVYVNGANALKDEDEVLAWSLTDPDMQAYLESIPYKGKTAWNAFVDAIREFLGLPKAKETALSEVLAIADELFVLPVIESGKQELVKSAPSAKPIATQDQINLFNASVRGQKVKMTPTAEGQAALDTINDLGRQVEETPTMRQKAREYWDNATDNPQATKEAAKKATVRFLDKIETMVFSSDAALNNATRRLINETTMSEQEKMGILLSISSSQAVHPDALANLFIRYGGLNYDPSIYKYVATDKKDNFVSLVQGIDTIGSKYGLTKEQAERVSHTAFEAKRLSSIARFNRALKVEIDDLRDMARTSPDPTARDLASKEVRRKVKDFKFVHMTDEQIQRGLDLFKTIPELNALVDTWNGIRENSRKELVESGLWSEQEAEGLLSNMDYVPFYREDQLEKGKGPKEFLRNLQVQAKEKKLKGSDKPVADIFDNMARWTQYAVKRSVMNRLALAKIDAAVEMGIAKKVEKQKQGDNSVRVWRNGEAEYYSLDDPLFMDAFTGLESVAIPSLKYFAKLSNLLRQSVVLYPLFSISQVPQDAFAAMFSSGLKTRFALTIPARAAKEFIKTLFKSSQTHKELERIGVVGIRDFTAAIAREDAEIYAGLKARPGVLNKVKSFLEHVAMSSDNAVRQAVYEASIAQGTSRAEAIEKAFNLINFRNRGSSKSLAAMGQVIPFFNAYLAAQHVAYRTISGVGISPTERKAALGTLAATTASVMALSLIYAMLIGDDEDYLNKPSVMRDRLFMIPGTGMTIPIRSDIFSIPKIITEHTYMLMTDNGASDGRKFRDSMKAALGNALFSPTVVPQAIKPLVEVGINYNFFQGRPLVGTYQKGLETERQFNDSTSELAKWFGQTGLISPIAADHLIRGMFGSAGGLALYMTNFALHNDPEVPRPALSFMEAVAALPGTSGFVSKEYETALKNDFYVLRDEVSTAVNTLNDLKKRSPHEIEEFLADETNLTRVGMAKAVNRITKNLTDIRREISRITASDQMSASEKAEQIRELKAIEIEILQNVDLKALREMANL